MKYISRVFVFLFTIYMQILQFLLCFSFNAPLPILSFVALYALIL